MKEQRYFLMFFFAILLFSTTIALVITKFDGDLNNSGSITFNGSQIITKNLTISKYANITSASLNISGFQKINYNQSLINISTIKRNMTGVGDFQIGSNGTNYLAYLNSNSAEADLCSDSSGSWLCNSIDATFAYPERIRIALNENDSVASLVSDPFLGFIKFYNNGLDYTVNTQDNARNTEQISNMIIDSNNNYHFTAVNYTRFSKSGADLLYYFNGTNNTWTKTLVFSGTPTNYILENYYGLYNNTEMLVFVEYEMGTTIPHFCTKTTTSSNWICGNITTGTVYDVGNIVPNNTGTFFTTLVKNNGTALATYLCEYSNILNWTCSIVQNLTAANTQLQTPSLELDSFGKAWVSFGLDNSTDTYYRLCNQIYGNWQCDDIYNGAPGNYNDYSSQIKIAKGKLYVNNTYLNNEVRIVLNNNLRWTDVNITYPNNLNINISNSSIFYLNGIFNNSSQTNDFSANLNQAINNTACDCINCTLVGNNCTIPFYFSSQSSGILFYNLSTITYHSYPLITLNTPINNYVDQTTTANIFNCSVSDITSLQNITLQIFNSSNVLIYSNSTNISLFTNSSRWSHSLSIPDTYKWNCLAYNNESYFNTSSNNTLIITLLPPINQIYPTPTSGIYQNSWLNSGTNIPFNCSVFGSNLDSMFLYSNFTGTWGINQTINSISSGIYNFTKNISDGTYKYTCAVNQTPSGAITFGQQGNYTFGIDTIFPITNNITLATNAGTPVFTFINNASDNNLYQCNYTILLNDTLTKAPLSSSGLFNCNNITSATSGNYGTFVLVVDANDFAGNIVEQNISFTTSASTGTIIIGGGGGGTPSNIETNTTWQMFIDNGQSSSLNMYSGASRQKYLIFKNNGSETKSLVLKCVDVNNSLCEYIFFNKDLKLLVGKQVETTVPLTITLPDDIEQGQYIVSIYAQDAVGGKHFVTLTVTVGTFGAITGLISKIATSTTIGGISIPISLIALASWLFIGITLFFVFKNNRLGPAIGILGGFIMSIVVVFFI